MIKLILNIIGFVLVIIFIGLNMDTKVDIHFWFNQKLTIENVYLFVALGISFILGVFISIPFYIKGMIKNKKNIKSKFKKKNENIDYGRHDQENIKKIVEPIIEEDD